MSSQIADLELSFFLGGRAGEGGQDAAEVVAMDDEEVAGVFLLALDDDRRLPFLLGEFAGFEEQSPDGGLGVVLAFDEQARVMRVRASDLAVPPRKSGANGTEVLGDTSLECFPGFVGHAYSVAESSFRLRGLRPRRLNT